MFSKVAPSKPQIRLVRLRDDLKHRLSTQPKLSASSRRSMACAMSSTNVENILPRLQKLLGPRPPQILVSSLPRRQHNTRSMRRLRKPLLHKGRSKPLHPNRVSQQLQTTPIHQPMGRTRPICAKLLLPKRSFKANGLCWLRALIPSIRAPRSSPRRRQAIQGALNLMLALEWSEQSPKPKRGQ